MKHSSLWAVLVALLGAAVPMTGLATTRTWDGGAGTTNWSDANNWNPDGVPVDGDAVVIQTAAANVFLASSSAMLDSFTITNTATLTFNGNTNAQLKATNVYVMLNATVTHSVITPMTTNADGLWYPDSRVWIVCTNLTVGPGGKINTDTKGYKGGYGGSPRTNGAGPGGGTNNWTGSGAGYGGRGGYSGQNIGGAVYGSASNPDEPGSGSGGRDGAGSGANGGGWVRLEAADQVTVDGAITANGGSPGDAFGGGASGGGILIRCRSIRGGGAITAHGGHGTTDGANRGGGGGGGRIAVLFDPVAQSNVNLTAKPTIQFGANNGWAHNGSTLVEENAIVEPGVWQYSGGLGTIYLSDGSFFPGPGTQGGEVIIPSGLNAVVNSLTISNSILSLPAGASLTVSNDLTLTKNFAGLKMTNGTLNVLGNLSATADNYAFSYVGCASGATFTVGGNVTVGNKYTFRCYSDVSNATLINIGGSLTITNAGRLFTYAGRTNGLAANEYGMLISLTGDVVIASNAYLRPACQPYNGGACRYVVPNLTVLPGVGGIDASALGYAGGGNYGYATNNGFGPGGGSNAWLGSGGGYGGAGGRSAVAGGRTYGSVSHPIQPGGGAGGRDASYGNPSRTGSTGGGVVWVEAVKRITLGGPVRADADATRDGYGGGGAGGSVYLVCETFSSSNAIITANGAQSSWDGANACGGGGGGRIAVLYNAASQALLNASARPTLQIAANHGPAYNGAVVGETVYPGAPGSIYLTDSSFFPGSVLQGGSINIPGVTTFNFSSLIVSNSRAIFTGATVNVSGDLTIANNWAGLETTNTTLTVGGNVNASCALAAFTYIRCAPGASLSVLGNFTVADKYTMRVYAAPSNATTVSVAQNLVVTNAGGLHLYSGATTDVSTAYGMLVSVTGDVFTAPSSWIFPYAHPSNGGVVQVTARNVTIATNSGFNANESGYEGGLHGSNPGNDGWGPGRGKGLSGGGGYGGTGGLAVATSYGWTYGDSNAPVQAGSGGAGYNSGTYGCAGGGSIWLQIAKTLTLQGSITANGNRFSTYGGGSSGGGIYITCRTFIGDTTGKLSAKGGARAATYPAEPGTAGGGGRIALWRMYDKSVGAIALDASGGIGAGSGTVVVADIPIPRGSVIIVR